MKLKLLGVTAIAAASLTAASAHAYNLTFTDGTSAASRSDITAGSMFTDDYDFTIPTASDDTFSATFTETKLSNISSPTLALFTSGGTPESSVISVASTPMAEYEELDVSGLAAGSYYLQVAGTVGASGSGAYSFSAASAVSATPEPATWALMIAGVGMVGGALRYSRRNGAALIAA